MGIGNAYEAYCFDEAVWRFGTGVQAEVDEAGKPKQKKVNKDEVRREALAQNAFRRLVGLPQKFRDITQAVKKG